MSVHDALDVVDQPVLGQPAPLLRGVVDFYSGYRQRGLAPAVHRGLPSPYLTLIFTLDEPLCVAESGSGPTEYDALLGGLHTEPAFVRHDGAQSGLQLRVDPLWARALFGLPAGELAAGSVPAATVLGRFVDEVRDRLLSAHTWPARFAVLDDALLQLLRRGSAAAPAVEVRAAWQTLLHTGGRIGVSELTDQIGWSDRHLARQLRIETGLSTKTAGRVIRFDAARLDLHRRAGSIADVAASRGYYDQSHLVRDFTEFTGLPPTRWLAEETTPAATPIEEF